jgi:DNA-binding NarL/FixJ family response regulator
VLAALDTFVAPALTPREQEVLRLLELGLRFKQIAAELGISEATTKGDARGLFRKLEVTSRAEAVFESRRRGLLL